MIEWGIDDIFALSVYRCAYTLAILLNWRFHWRATFIYLLRMIWSIILYYCSTIENNMKIVVLTIRWVCNMKNANLLIENIHSQRQKTYVQFRIRCSQGIDINNICIQRYHNNRSVELRWSHEPTGNWTSIMYQWIWMLCVLADREKSFGINPKVKIDYRNRVPPHKEKPAEYKTKSQFNRYYQFNSKRVSNRLESSRALWSNRRILHQSTQFVCVCYNILTPRVKVVSLYRNYAKSLSIFSAKTKAKEFTQFTQNWKPLSRCKRIR